MLDYLFDRLGRPLINHTEETSPHLPGGSEPSGQVKEPQRGSASTATSQAPRSGVSGNARRKRDSSTFTVSTVAVDPSKTLMCAMIVSPDVYAWMRSSMLLCKRVFKLSKDSLASP